MKINSTVALAMVAVLSSMSILPASAQHSRPHGPPSTCVDYGDGRDRHGCHGPRPDNDKDNVGAAIGIGIVGLTLGAIIAGAAADKASSVPEYRDRNDYEDWFRYCSSRYRSFDPRTGTFMGYDGRRHPCQ